MVQDIPQAVDGHQGQGAEDGDRVKDQQEQKTVEALQIKQGRSEEGGHCHGRRDGSQRSLNSN